MSSSKIQVDQYANHLHVLSWAARQNRLHIPLEFGCGYYSTALIQALGGESVESMSTWYDRLKPYYPKLIFDLDWTPRKQYSFVFVDSAPEESRVEFVKKYLHLSQMWILHDATPDWEHVYQYNSLKRLFNFNKVVGDFPNTLILSNHKITYEGL
jgi:hypothetical protein